MDGVTPRMRLAWEEPFGPVLPIMRVRDAVEAVQLVNNSEYGLQTSTFTRDIDVALSNSFGIGGTKASLVFRRVAD